MKYNLTISRSAQKHLSRVNREDQKRIIDAIHSLAGNPRPSGCVKLSGRPAWRIRIGNYRVIYEIHDDKLLIIIITLGHRREIYRK